MRRWIVPAATGLALVLCALGDHYFRDEFYYLACSHRLAWGYVDQPPLSIALLWVVRHLAGESLLTLRTAAAVIEALTVWTTGSIARRLGAGAFGETFAMLAAAVAPEFLAIGSFYSMNVLDILLWALVLRVFLDVIDASPAAPLSRWVLLGALIGLGLENKIGVLWLGAGIGAALALTRSRRLLLTPGPWIAAAIAAALFAPHVLWQVVHGWPTLEFIRNASAQKMQRNTPLGFLVAQVMSLNPVLFPIWFGGLVFLLFGAGGRFRPMAVVFLVVAAILIVNRTSRAEYLLPGYTMLFAAGGVALEQRTARAARRAAITTCLIAGAVAAPMAIPILPIDAYVRYSRALGQAPSTEEKKEVGRLPQFLADREGWDRLVDQIAAVWDTLSAEERAKAAVFVGNYGEAGAIERLGRTRGLVALSGHNNYWLWGPQGRSGEILIVLARSRERLDGIFDSVQQAGRIECGDCMPYENHQLIFVCRRMKPPPLPERWPQLKHYE